MANDVFANGREVSCKAADGKTICCFPDVCFTPPQTPATPPGVPIPYPNTAFAKDTTSGSKKVKISNKEVMLKNKSYFKTSTGDEAGCAPKKGIVTSKTKGKAYFTSWSMDVKVESANVVRHMDMTTHNHASLPANAPPWMHLDEMSAAVQQACSKDIEELSDACENSTPEACEPECYRKQKCILVPKRRDSDRCCDPATTGHHMIEDHWVTGLDDDFPTAQGSTGYGDAPTVCVHGGRNDSEHGIMHCIQGLYEESFMPGGPNSGKTWDYQHGKEATLRAHSVAFHNSECERECLEAQLDDYYGSDGSRPLKPPSRQSLGATPADNRLLRDEAETAIDMIFGGVRL